MSLRVNDFAAGQRAALFAARVSVRAAVCSSERDIWGVSDPLCHPPVEVLRPRMGGRSRPDACRSRPAIPRSVRVIVECAAVAGAVSMSFTSAGSTCVRFFRKTAFIWVNAHTTESKPETVSGRHVLPVPRLRVSFIASLPVRSIVATARGHHDATLSGGPRPGQATPLRSVPDGLRA